MQAIKTRPERSERSQTASRPGPIARWNYPPLVVRLVVVTAALHATQARASLFQGEALDNLSNILSWVVLVVAPAVGIAVFWIVHILPEKIAEKKQHPQAKAIQCLCLLSLAFGGLLWPLAWLWAYSKPVLYKMAYGTDKVAHEGGEDSKERGAAHDTSDTPELKQLRDRVAELESQLAGKSANGGKA